jgi:hypothetical protein
MNISDLESLYYERIRAGISKRCSRCWITKSKKLEDFCLGQGHGIRNPFLERQEEEQAGVLEDDDAKKELCNPSIHPSIYAAFFPNSLFNAHSRISIECHPSSLLFSFSTSIDVPLPLLLSFNLLYE